MFYFLHYSYDIIVDIAPEVKWTTEEGYKNLKIVVEIDSDIDAQKTSAQELKRRHKSLGILRIVTDRGLQVIQGSIASSECIFSFVKDKNCLEYSNLGFLFETVFGL